MRGVKRSKKENALKDLSHQRDVRLSSKLNPTLPLRLRLGNLEPKKLPATFDGIEKQEKKCAYHKLYRYMAISPERPATSQTRSSTFCFLSHTHYTKFLLLK